MRWWALFPLAIIVIAVQNSLLMPMSIWGVLPDLVLIIVATIGLVKGPVVGGVSGFAAGLLIDIVGGRMIGLSALSKTAAGLFIGAVGWRIYGERRLVTVALIFAAALIDRSVYFWGARAFGVDFGFVSSVVKVIGPSAIYDALVSVIMYPIVVRAIRWITGEAPPKKAMRSGLEGG